MTQNSTCELSELNEMATVDTLWLLILVDHAAAQSDCFGPKVGAVLRSLNEPSFLLLFGLLLEDLELQQNVTFLLFCSTLHILVFLQFTVAF